MSKPRGNGCQRRLLWAAKDRLRGTGASCEVDFSGNDGHQVLIVTRSDGSRAKVDLVSSPRDEERVKRSLLKRLDAIVAETRSTAHARA